MLNREQIIEKVNAEYGWSVDPYDESIIEGFVDLEMLGIDDSMMEKCIDERVFVDESDILNGDLIIKSCKGKKKGKGKKKAPAPATANPFGAFEEAIAQVVGMQAAPMVEEIVKSRLDKWIEENSSRIEKPIVYIQPETGAVMEDTTHEQFETVCNFVQYNFPVLLTGPAGTGKNHLCKQVADFFGLDFYFANAVTQEHKLTGFIDANGVYHETQFYKAFKDGGLFMFDELDASDPEVLVTFNAALANGYMDFPVGRVDAHENFRAVAAANTTGNGASYEYVGRNQIDAATLNRFGLVQIGYSPRIEATLTSDNDLLDFIREFRAACDEYGISHVASYRDITRCSVLAPVMGATEALKTGLVRNMETDDMNMMVGKFKDKVDEWSTAFCELASA